MLTDIEEAKLKLYFVDLVKKGRNTVGDLNFLKYVSNVSEELDPAVGSFLLEEDRPLYTYPVTAIDIMKLLQAANMPVVMSGLNFTKKRPLDEWADIIDLTYDQRKLLALVSHSSHFEHGLNRLQAYRDYFRYITPVEDIELIERAGLV